MYWIKSFTSSSHSPAWSLGRPQAFCLAAKRKAFHTRDPMCLSGRSLCYIPNGIISSGFSIVLGFKPFSSPMSSLPDCFLQSIIPAFRRRRKKRYNAQSASNQIPMDIKTALKKVIDPMPEDKPVGSHPASDLLAIKDVVAPPLIDVDFDLLKIGNFYYRTLFVAGYPRFVSANWLEPLISFNHTLEIAMYVYPTRSEEVLENLKRKVGEMEATIQPDMKRGRVIEPSVQVALEDALSLP